MKTTKKIRDLVVFKKLTVGPVVISNKKISATYIIEKLNGEIFRNEFIYSYEEIVFDSEKPECQNLASVMSAQIALNYGLFCEEIHFDGLFDDTDRRLLSDKMENTSREIYINKFLKPNEFLLPEYQGMQLEKQKHYTAARLVFSNSMFKNAGLQWNILENDHECYLVLSSGGKDSLLSYGVLNEIGKEVHPVFINESGRHWYTALNTYRFLKKTNSNTARVWCNSDRIFNWMLRHLHFIRKDFNKLRADDYPIRLWTVAIFLFGILPVARKRKLGRIVIGNEYDSTQKMKFEGITHYNGYFDQSRYFDNAFSRYYMKKGWSHTQFSILRSLSELLIMEILVKRYPDLQQYQISCHAASEKDGRIYPCGKCEKCRRIVGMLKALDEDPKRCGYSEDQIHNSLKTLSAKSVRQIGSDASHLYKLLITKNLIDINPYTLKLAKSHEEIKMLRFDNERSMLNDIPDDLRKSILEIYLHYVQGAVKYKNRTWVPFEVLNSEEIKSSYPFELSPQNNLFSSKVNIQGESFLWEQLTWPEIKERLEIVDTAILPCGAIEQHGPHLPVDTDYFDAKYLAIKVAEAVSDPKPFVLPAIPYGVSYHHEDFPGTISVTNESLSKLIYDIGINLAQNGIKKLIIINGHGDNAPTLNFAAQMINRDAKIFVCVDSGETSDEDLNKLIETPNDIHAGEIETSTSLAIRPELVKLDKAVESTTRFGSSYLDFSSKRGIPWYVRTKKISETGILGNPLKSSAEKGKKIWEIMIAHLVKFVEDIKNSKLEDLYQKRY